MLSQDCLEIITTANDPAHAHDHSMLDLAHLTCGSSSSALGVDILTVTHGRQVHLIKKKNTTTKGHKGNVSLMKV